MDMRTCEVCGKQYDKCKTPYIAEGYFRWQDVACSPTCAMEWLARKEQAMKAGQEESVPAEAPAAEPKKATKKAKKTSTANDKVESQPD